MLLPFDLRLQESLLCLSLSALPLRTTSGSRQCLQLSSRHTTGPDFNSTSTDSTDELKDPDPLIRCSEALSARFYMVHTMCWLSTVW